MGVREIFHIDVIPLLLTGTRDRDRPARQRSAREARHHERVAHSRPVRDPVPQDREVLAVHLQVTVREKFGGHLGGDVHVAGPRQLDRRLLGQLAVTCGGTVHPHRAGQQNPRAALAARRLKDARRAVDVHPDRAERVRGDDVHVARAREVKNGVTAADSGLERRLVEDVDLTVAGGRIHRANGDVDHENLVSRPGQVVDHVRTDEATATGHDDSHAHLSDSGERAVGA